MTVYELYDPSVHVSGGPPPESMGQVMEALKEDCGWIVNAIDWVVTLFWEPGLREAIINKLAGDFNAMSSMKAAWGDVELALQETSANYEGLGWQLPVVWEGQGGRTAVGRLNDIRDMHADQAEAAGLIKDQVGNLIDVSVATAEVVVGALRLINDICQELIIAAAVPLVGWAKALVTGAAKVRRIITLINRCLRAIERITSAVQTALRLLTYFNAGMGVLNTVLNFGETATAADAGWRVEETSDRGFG